MTERDDSATRHAAASSRSRPVLALVVPCYDEQEVIAETARRLRAVLDDLAARDEIDAASFVYFVDDGSRDGTWELIREAHARDDRIKGLRLARNAGHQYALLAGLLAAKDRSDCVISLDSDLQQDEGAIRSFLEKYRQGADVVYGVRTDRSDDKFFKRRSALLFYALMRLMGVRLVKNHADYRLASRRALDAIAEYGEYNLFLRGVFADVGFETAVVPFESRSRYAGRSKYPPARMLALAFDGITSFSVAPLRIVTLIGALIFLFSLTMTIYALYVRAVGDVVPGWASTVIPIYFIGGVQVMLLGVVGEYVGRIYKEVKRRPRFIKETELF